MPPQSRRKFRGTGISGYESEGEEKQLEKKKNELLIEIEKTNKDLKNTGKTLDATMRFLQQLEKKIKLRENLISNYQSEILLINKKIDSCVRITGNLEYQLERIKNDYMNAVLLEYKLASGMNENLFLFAAKDINDAYFRKQYFKSMRNYRRWLASEIIEKQAELSEILDELRKARQESQEALKQQELQKSFLNSELKEKENLLRELKSKEKELKQILARKEQERKQIETRIRKIIEEEIAMEKRRAEAKVKEKTYAKKINESRESEKISSSSPRSELRLTPEAAELSDAFENNKGRLPWPVERGAIISGFGVQSHAYLKNVTIKNDGIDISTTAGAQIRAIFKGIVSGIFSVQGFGNVVIIRHGEYLTVYANLSQVTIQKNNQVSARQVIGTLPTGKEQATLNFQIRKGTTPLNPISWLAQ